MCGITPPQTRDLCTNPEKDPLEYYGNLKNLKKQSSLDRHPRQTLFTRQTVELYFKAENVGAGCERVFVNVLLQHAQLIVSDFIQTAQRPSCFSLSRRTLQSCVPRRLREGPSECAARCGPSLKLTQTPDHQSLKDDEQRAFWSTRVSPGHTLTRAKSTHSLAQTHTHTHTHSDLYMMLHSLLFPRTQSRTHGGMHICTHSLIISETELNLEMCQRILSAKIKRSSRGV